MKWPWEHKHKWYPVSVDHYVDVSYGGHAHSTNVVSRCLTCGKVETQSHYGVRMTLAELRGAPVEFEQPRIVGTKPRLVKK